MIHFGTPYWYVRKITPERKIGGEKLPRNGENDLKTAPQKTYICDVTDITCMLIDDLKLRGTDVSQHAESIFECPRFRGHR